MNLKNLIATVFLLTLPVTVSWASRSPTFTRPTLNIVPDEYFQQIAKGRAEFKSVRTGDTIYAILKREGFSQGQVNLVVAENVMPRHWPLSKGQLYKVTRSSGAGFNEVRFFDLPRDIAYSFWRRADEAGSFETTANLKTKSRTINGAVRGSLLASIQAQISDAWVGMRFMDAFALDFNVVKSLQRGARYSLTVEQKFDGSRFLGYGEILQAQLEINGTLETRHFVSFSGGGTFIDRGDVHLDRPLFAPVNYLRISSHFEPHRLHPIKRRRIAHMGIDFELPQGEAVYSARAGRVLRTGRSRGAGNFVAIRHPGGLESYYNHLASIQTGIRPGVFVKDGQKIGTVGCTGYCTKPHLHFAVKRFGRFINPATIIRSYPFNQKALVREELASANH